MSGLSDYTDDEIAEEHYRRMNAGTCNWCGNPFTAHVHGKCPPPNPNLWEDETGGKTGGKKVDR
jgi:hypothetical protein